MHIDGCTPVREWAYIHTCRICWFYDSYSYDSYSVGHWGKLHADGGFERVVQAAYNDAACKLRLGN